MKYFELIPAYGKDYKTAKAVQEAWESGNDFIGDYQLGFQYVSKTEIPKPCTVNLRYDANRKLTVVKVA